MYDGSGLFRTGEGETLLANCWRLAILAILTLSTANPALADHNNDRHAGYYYPKPVTHEVYKARSRELPGANRERRIDFVTGIGLSQSDRPYPPRTAMFAKGKEAEKLIILSLVDGYLNTIYRARAGLALLTTRARTTPIFQEFEVEAIFTFLDLCKLLGFQQVTISDGKDFSHQIEIQ